MNPLLSDLISHMEWADATICTFAAAHEQSSSDRQLCDGTLHILECQNGYLSLMRKTEFLEMRRDDFPTIAAIVPEIVRYYQALADFLRSADEESMRSNLNIPWTRGAGSAVTVEDGLAQVVMHSQYHRGQNAARLRQLSLAPPLTDLVMWYLTGKPAPARATD